MFVYVLPLFFISSMFDFSTIFFAGKHQAKKANCMQLAHNVDAKILFPEVSDVEIVEGYPKTIKELTKVVFSIECFSIFSDDMFIW